MVPRHSLALEVRLLPETALACRPRALKLISRTPKPSEKVMTTWPAI